MSAESEVVLSAETKPKPKVDHTRTQSSTLQKRNSSIHKGTLRAKQQQQLYADTAAATPPRR